MHTKEKEKKKKKKRRGGPREITGLRDGVGQPKRAGLFFHLRERKRKEERGEQGSAKAQRSREDRVGAHPSVLATGKKGPAPI